MSTPFLKEMNCGLKQSPKVYFCVKDSGILTKILKESEACLKYLESNYRIYNCWKFDR